MNKVILVGNLCKDIQLKYTINGNATMSNTLAIKNDFKNANGEYDSEFVNVVFWKQNAEFLNKYAEKGNKLLVEGRLKTRSYDKQDGTKGYITEVMAEKIEILNTKKKEIKSEETIELEKAIQKDPFTEFAEEIEIDENDLPF